MPVTSSAAVTLLRVCLILSAVAASVFCGCGRTQADRTDMFVLGTEDRGTYECLTIEMTVADGDRVKSYLLVPDHGPGDRLPAVLMLHDHGARFDIGKEKLACPPSDEPLRVRNSSAQWADKYFDGAYMADSLAAGGYVVLVADALYWGDRCSRDALAWSEMTFGRSPSLRDSLDFPEIARLICPKPMLFVSGTDDPLFPAASAAEAYAEMSGIYSESGEKAAFSSFFSEGGHHCGQAVQDSIYAFFAGAVR